MNIIGTIILVLLLIAPTLYVILNRWLTKRRMEEAGLTSSEPAQKPARELQETPSAARPGAVAAAAQAGAAPATAKAVAAAATQLKAGALRRASTFEWREAAAAGHLRAAAPPRRASISRLSRIEAMPPLKRAVVWSELLKPPPGLDPPV